jgi:ketosteroid isomerase-like protein
MTSRRLALVILLALSSLQGCGTCEDEGIPPELQNAIGAFYASIDAGDVETRIGLFTQHAVMMPNHWTRIEGKEAIAETFRSGEGWEFRLRDREVVDMDVSGNLAYTVNAYLYTYHRKHEEPQWHRTKNVHIWKKMQDGSWKLHVDVWNSDVPIDEFPNE